MSGSVQIESERHEDVNIKHMSSLKQGPTELLGWTFGDFLGLGTVQVRSVEFRKFEFRIGR